MKVAMLTGWQGGPATIEIECDELTLDDGSVGLGIVVLVDTVCDDRDDDGTLEAGSAMIDARVTRIRVTLAGSREQARELIAALEEAISP